MTLTSEIADAIGEVIDLDSVSVTKPGGGTFSARRNRGEKTQSRMHDDGYLPESELQIIVTATELSAASYAPAVNDEITASGVVYVITAIRVDAAFTYISATKEK